MDDLTEDEIKPEPDQMERLEDELDLFLAALAGAGSYARNTVSAYRNDLSQLVDWLNQRQPLLTAWGLSFIILFRDLSISILMYTSSTTPSSVALLGIFDQGWITGAAAYSIIMTVISAGVVAMIIKTSSRIESVE